MKTEPNESAAPIITVIDGNWVKQSPDNRNGLTKREYFAAMAMKGYLSGYPNYDPYPKDVAKFAIEMADSLIEALNK